MLSGKRGREEMQETTDQSVEMFDNKERREGEREGERGRERERERERGEEREREGERPFVNREVSCS